MSEENKSINNENREAWQPDQTIVGGRSDAPGNDSAAPGGGVQEGSASEPQSQATVNWQMVDAPRQPDNSESSVSGQSQNLQPPRDYSYPQQGMSPKPLPGSENIYRFQNPKVEKAKKKAGQKKSGGILKIIVAAVIFGIVAGGCFFGLNKLMGGGSQSSDGGKIGVVDTADSNGGLSVVSGSAVAQGDVSDIVEKVMPSIVAITETSTVSSYFGQSYSAEGAGSGVIVKEDKDELLIVTNNHVVERSDNITVTFIDDSTAKATIKGTDPTADLAVISLKISDLKEETRNAIRVANLGDSEKVKVGNMAIAIGNALGYGQSVTVGYISAKDREVKVSASDNNGTNTMVLLQTDAAINPGNSGGALLDASGNVIGINSVKYADTTVEGIGYAIPVSDAIPIINDLMNREVLKDSEKGYLGITGRTVSEELSEAYRLPVGVFVSTVSDSGAAKKAGIKQGDIITKINGKAVMTIEQVQNKVNNTKAGTEMTVTISRNQNGEYKEQDVKVILKGSETLDELEDENDQSGGDSGQDSIPDDLNPYGYGDDSYDGGNQILPW